MRRGKQSQETGVPKEANYTATSAAREREREGAALKCREK